MIKNSIIAKVISIFCILILSSCNRDIGNDIKSIIDSSEKENKEKTKQDEKSDKESKKQNDDKVKRPFIFVWKVGADGSFSIPMNGEFIEDYKFDLKWYRVDNPNIRGEKLKLDGSATKRYNGLLYQKEIEGLPGAGEYVMEITGIFPAFRFGNSIATISDEILEIRQWGDIEWVTMEKAFSGCKNLKVTATDAPNLSNVADMSYMFYRAASFNESINHWDVSKVTNMFSMFEKAKSFNQPLDKWDVGKVRSMNKMFKDAVSFSQYIENWNVHNVTDMGEMFSGAQVFDEPLNKWNVSSVVNMFEMFKNAEIFNQSLNSWKVNDKANLNGMFAGARYFDKDNISKWKVSNKSMY